MEAQSGIVDTAAVEALNGDGTALVLVDMLKERGLLQYSAAGKCYVTGELVTDTNTCLKAMCYSPHAYIDAGSITNSWMHLVMSDQELVRLGVEIELELDIGSTPSTRDAAATVSFRAGDISLTDHLLVLHVRAHRPGGAEEDEEDV